ncbi:hypothetical protein TorRG33x02_338880 [Trema orientale]|uniref:Uncharacterized protein n=1 Tax=Trema orientale TaxID=63057 RepID=A0A2P5AWX6_TREOI|nr:hypothetical protein TorRG33x02_338880 [Trema orientale]
MERARAKEEGCHNRKLVVHTDSTAQKMVIIGGNVVLWEEVENLLNSMNIKLVPTKEPVYGMDTCNSELKKKSGTKELHNLQFNVKYDKK